MLNQLSFDTLVALPGEDFPSFIFPVSSDAIFLSITQNGSDQRREGEREEIGSLELERITSSLPC